MTNSELKNQAHYSAFSWEKLGLIMAFLDMSPCFFLHKSAHNQTAVRARGCKCIASPSVAEETQAPTKVRQ